MSKTLTIHYSRWDLGAVCSGPFPRPPSPSLVRWKGYRVGVLRLVPARPFPADQGPSSQGDVYLYSLRPLSIEPTTVGTHYSRTGGRREGVDGREEKGYFRRGRPTGSIVVSVLPGFTGPSGSGPKASWEHITR